MHTASISPSDLNAQLLALSCGSLTTVVSYSSCVMNGVRFTTERRDLLRRTQNSGVSVKGGEGITWYGVLLDIYVVNYPKDNSVVLFKCKWFDTSTTKKGVRVYKNITSICIKNIWYDDEPYILASQAEQVFYIDDLYNGSNWKVVEHFQHRHILDAPKFVKQSDINAKNHGKRLFNTRNGRKSYAQRRTEGGTGGSDPFIVWMRTHQNDDGTWVNNAASQTFDELMRFRLEIAPDGSRLTVAQEIDVFRRVLGPRRDCIVGIGPSQPSSSRTQMTQSLMSQIREKDNALAEKDKAIAEKDKALAETSNQMNVIMASLKAANIAIVNIDGGDGDAGGDEGGDEGGWDDASV